ncbi:MAG: cyclic-di-AMP receptor [Anaerolineae bacterium]
MKVVLAITTSEGADDIADALRDKSFRVTMMSSMGGFLRRRNATLMIGVADEQVDDVLQVIREHAPAPKPVTRGLLSRQTVTPQSSVTAFVLDMSRLEHYQP